MPVILSSLSTAITTLASGSPDFELWINFLKNIMSPALLWHRMVLETTLP